MSLNDWRIIFFSIGIIILVIILLPLSWGFFQLNQENFTSMAVLGRTSREGNYTPISLYYARAGMHPITSLDISNITGVEWKWNIVLYNHMDSTQYMWVGVKLLNENMKPPNNDNGDPSLNSTIIYETGKILTKGETVNIPFNWRVLAANSDSLIINKMSCSDTNVTIISAPNVALMKNENNTAYMRLVFELWLYDANKKALTFGMAPPEDRALAGEPPHIVWNQIWIKIKTN
jgi:hypothetical protein